MNILLLGTGTSFGVPQIACRCAVCRSDDPRNKRTRCAALVTAGGSNILIDTPPDLRTQAIREGIERVDAVLVTHAHADHLHGIDDLRAFSSRQGALPLYGAPHTVEHIRVTFRYIFEKRSGVDTLPEISLNPITGPFEAGGIRITPVPVKHAEDDVYGYRFAEADAPDPLTGGIAYVTDCSHIPEASMALLRDLDILVLGALRDRPHHRHFTFERALDAVERLAPKRTLFTHMTHDNDYETLKARLPEGVEPGFDGMRVEV